MVLIDTLASAAIAASDRRRQPCCAIRLSAASMIRSRSLGGAAAAPPDTRGERPFAIASRRSARQLARPRRGRGDRAFEQWGQAVLGHQDIESGPRAAAGA